jgi:tetratricopeptide (TPR) repeat protein
MKKALVSVIIYFFIAAYTVWGQDAMHFYDLGLKSSMAYKKIQYFTKAMELDPGLTEAYAKRGMLYYFQEKYTETIQDFQRVAELKPFDSGADIMLGLAFMKLENYDEAISHFTRAIELDPQLASAYSHRSEANRLEGLIEESIRDATMAMELGGSERIIGGAFTTRSKAYRELGQIDRADADFKKASKLDPEQYKYSMLTSTELLAESASEVSLPKRVSWMGAFLIVALFFVVIFKLTISAPQKKDHDH